MTEDQLIADLLRTNDGERCKQARRALDRRMSAGLWRPTGTGKQKRFAVRVRGVDYVSVSSACIAMGVSYCRVRIAIKRGREAGKTRVKSEGMFWEMVG